MTAPRKMEVFGGAKFNMGWRVGEQRPDGYHDVTGLIQTISLADRLEISTHEEGPGLTVEVPGFPELESDDNLVCLAAGKLAGRVEVPPTRVVIHKTVPVAAGLGGGSADAAAALVGLNAAWKAGLSATELVKLGAEVSSDVPALLMGGLVAVGGRGERVRNVGCLEGWLVLGVGAERVSAAEAYSVFDDLPRQRLPSFLWHNDLEAAACAIVPGLSDRVEEMRSATGVAFVSGSGPTVVGVAGDERGAQQAAERVSSAFFEVLVAQASHWGVRLRLAKGS